MGAAGPAIGVTGAALLAAGSACAQAPAFAPCLQARPDLDAYVAAFEAQGWAAPDPDRRGLAMEALGQARFWSTVSSAAATPEALAEELALARALATPRPEDGDVLVRGPVALLVNVLDRSGGAAPEVQCLLAAPDMPDVEALLAAGPVTREEGASWTTQTRRREPGWHRLTVAAFRRELGALSPRPLPGQASVHVTGSLEAPL